MKDSDLRNTLMEKYKVRGKGMTVIKEEIKQREESKTAEVKRYDRQNNLFHTNQRQLFKELDDTSDDKQVSPESVEAKTFWSGLWDQPTQHNGEANWLRDVRDELRNVHWQGDLEIDVGRHS